MYLYHLSTLTLYLLYCFEETEKYINGLVQDCSISSALAMKILQSCIKPSIHVYSYHSFYHSSTLSWHIQLKSLMEEKDPIMSRSKCNGCWWPGDMSSHDIDLVLPEYSGLSIIMARIINSEWIWCWNGGNSLLSYFHKNLVVFFICFCAWWNLQWYEKKCLYKWQINMKFTSTAEKINTRKLKICTRRINCYTIYIDKTE